MNVTWPKIAALIVSAAWAAAGVAVVLLSGGPRGELLYLFVLLVPLGLIWFPEAVGSATGYIGHGFVDHETPPWLVAASGWFFLVGYPLILWLIT